jgi:pimeloyl-ACP methyl ester carboxylesterase
MIPARSLSRCAGLLSAVLLVTAVRAEPVSYDYLGLGVVGNLEVAPGRSLKDDGAVLLVHDSLAHHNDMLMKRLQTSLAAKGVNSLAISLSLGLNQRKGPFDCGGEHDHRHGDAGDEIVAWAEWLQQKGASKVALAGLGRGATQVALGVVERPDLPVSQLALVTPPALSPAAISARYQREFGQPLSRVLEPARKLVDDGEGDTLINAPGFLTCKPARTTAAAFVDYYGGDHRQDIINLLPEVKQQTLIVTADADPDSQKFEQTPMLNSGTKLILREAGQGVNPGFTGDSSERLADLLATFLKSP